MMSPLALVKLSALMEISRGKAEVGIGLIDGPVAMDHTDLTGSRIRALPGKLSAECTLANSMACRHGTFVAGVLCATRNSAAPAICPHCTLLVRPIFAETTAANGPMPSATPEELAAAIIDCIKAGARLLNLSVALTQPSLTGQRELEEALDWAARRDVIVVAAAGNQGTIGSSAITRHPWVIPVVAYDSSGLPLDQSNLGRSIGRRGLGAAGDEVTSLGAAGNPMSIGGTSVAAPFVTGTIALLWSLFPMATAATLKIAVTQAHTSRRRSVVPPLLNAWAAYQFIQRRWRR